MARLSASVGGRRVGAALEFPSTACAKVLVMQESRNKPETQMRAARLETLAKSSFSASGSHRLRRHPPFPEGDSVARFAFGTCTPLHLAPPRLQLRHVFCLTLTSRKDFIHTRFKRIVSFYFARPPLVPTRPLLFLPQLLVAILSNSTEKAGIGKWISFGEKTRLHGA